jgi:Leucine-rich repeat (LRR) protein
MDEFRIVISKEKCGDYTLYIRSFDKLDMIKYKIEGLFSDETKIELIELIGDAVKNAYYKENNKPLQNLDGLFDLGTLRIDSIPFQKIDDLYSFTKLTTLDLTNCGIVKLDKLIFFPI